MVREKYAVRLTPEERENLQRLVRGGKSPARMTTRARILLKTGDGWPAPQVAEALDVAKGTVYRIKRRFVEDGLEGALWERTQAHRYRKLDDRGEAHLVALACSASFRRGMTSWTLRLLARQRWRLRVTWERWPVLHVPSKGCASGYSGNNGTSLQAGGRRKTWVLSPQVSADVRARYFTGGSAWTYTRNAYDPRRL